MKSEPKNKKYYKLNRKSNPTKAAIVSARNDANKRRRKAREWTHVDCKTALLKFDQVPSLFQEPFIMSGYRRCDSSAWECIKSLFQATNESINIWSHMLALVVFVIRFGFVLASYKPWHDSFACPMFCFALGISLMLIMSVGAHLFNCMSIRAHHICFFFDYAGISVYSFTAGSAFYFYSRPVGTGLRLFDNPIVFLVISAVISFGSTLACCRSLCQRSRFGAAIRAGTYMVSWVFNTSPYLILLLSCGNGSPQCSSAASVHYFLRHCMFYAGGTMAYVLRVPERLMIGVFDVLGHSHHFLHILCCIGASDEFTAVEMDMIQRRSILEEFHGPTFLNSILLTALVVAGNIAVVWWCAKQLKFKKKN